MTRTVGDISVIPEIFIVQRKKVDKLAAWNQICYPEIEILPEGAKFECQHINRSRSKIVLTECDDGDRTVKSKAEKLRSGKQCSALSSLAAQLFLGP